VSKEKSVNRVEVSGFLRNVNLRSTSKGNSVCSFSLAVVTPTKDGKQYRNYVDCVAWSAQGERVAKWALDAKVYVIGRLQTSSWDDQKTGFKRYKTSVVCESVELTSSLLTKPPTEITPQRPIDDSDIPF